MQLLKNLFIGDYDSFSDEKSYRTFFVTNLFLFLGIATHIFYTCVFIYLETPIMVFVEFFSVIILAVAISINRNRIRYIPSLIMCIEIGVNGVLWAMILKSGYNHYMYTFVALLGAFLFLELTKKQKIFVTVFLMVCLNLSHSAENEYIAFIAYQDKDWITLITTNMVFLLLTTELTINEITNEALKSLHRETVEKMRDEIMLDPLTKAYNRRYFQENEKEFDQNAQVSDCCVVILDIDFFKKINDTYGHDAGDKVLIFLAEKMKNEFRAYDIVMRWGGEEFVILLKNATLANTVKKLNSFRHIIQRSFVQFNDKIIKFTFTAGVCKVKQGMSVSEAITMADKYLYDGKINGRNVIVYK